MDKGRRPGRHGLAAVLIALLTGLLGVAVPSGQAAAQPDQDGCLYVATVDPNNGIQRYEVADVPLRRDQLWPGGKPCMTVVFSRTSSPHFLRAIACGVMKYPVAHDGGRCELTAGAYFEQAARELGADKLVIERTAWCGAGKPGGCERALLQPEPMPWQLAATRDLAAGLDLMRQALADPGLQDQAMALFSSFVDRLATQNAE